MKRIREPESPSNDDKPYRRQLPVSCLFCRNKKLKCDREQPCSNCAARNIECTSAIAGKKASPHNEFQAALGVRPSTGPRLSTDDILARFQRLEQVVFRGRPPSLEDAQEGFTTAVGSLDDIMHTPTGWQSVAGAPPSRSREYLNQAAHAQSPQTMSPSPATTNAKGKLNKPIIPDLAAPAVQDLSQMMLRTSKYEAFLLGNPALDAATSDSSSSAPSSSLLSSHELSNTMPSELIAEMLFNHFVNNVAWVYHIFHAPTLHDDMRGIYEDIRENAPRVKVRKLSLIATILAIAAHFWLDCPEMPLSSEEAKSGHSQWAKLAERALEESKHDIDPSIETLQASILTSQFLPGFRHSSKRAFLGSTVHAARILGLHQTDSRRNVQRRMDLEYSLADLEVRRRVWWHIVCTDWMLSYMSGPQEGTYLCHPSQMNCLLPSNADDKDITHDAVNAIDFVGPDTAPTEMTYTLGKFWFAEFIRSFVDTACSAGLEVDELEYDQVIKLDEQANRCIKELPYYFQLDEANRKRSAEIVRQRPYIEWQREMMHFGFHTRISRLHRPFMTRGYKDPKYAYSRMICLRSARVVIELEKSMREMGNVMHQQTTSRLWIVVHHFFMATVTLVMDYCCHRDDPRAAERRAEILDCYKVLEKNQEESPIARKGLAHLKQVMNEWRAESATELQSDRNATGNGETTADSTASSQPQSLVAANASASAASAGYPTSYDPATIQYLGGMDMSGIDLAQDLWLDSAFAANFDPQWDALFNVLENQPGIYGMGV